VTLSDLISRQVTIDAILHVLCAQLMRDQFEIAKFLVFVI